MSNSKPVTWFFSIDEEEDFEEAGDTREDAILAGTQMAKACGADRFYISPGTVVDIDLLSVDFLIEELIQANQDNAPESSIWLETVSDKAKLDLQTEVDALLRRWLDKYDLHPNWIQLSQIEEFDLEAAQGTHV